MARLANTVLARRRNVLRSFSFRRFILAGMAGAALAVGAGCDKDEVKKPETDPSTTVFDDFAKRVDGYMKIRKSIVDSVGELDPTKSQAEITARSTALADGIMAARAEAKQGDIFTTEFAALVATLIKEEYKRRSISVQETRSDQQDELPDFKPAVNQLYPTTYPLATFPATLLPLLPTLPEQLEYRVVQHYLVLRDVEANVILDYMPNAVPMT
jgi:hypothetical protein